MASSWFNKWFNFLTYFKWVIIIFWLVMFGLSAHWGPKFLKQTKAAMNPPPNSDADIANKKFTEYFPDSDRLRTLVIFVERNTPGSVLGNYLETMTKELNETLRTNSATNQVLGFYTFWNNPALRNLSFSFLSPDYKASIIQVKYTKFSHQTDLGDYIEFVRDTVNPYSNDEFNIGPTGQDVLYQDITDGTASDMERMDVIVLPLALLTLAYVVRSYRLMIIPILSVLISLLTGYFIMLPISYHLDCSSVSPSVMMSLTIAMSIDYSLFLLTRYREEHARGKPNDKAVKNMEFFGGHIVAMSGGTLAITFVALALFPMSFLQSVGIGACLALVCTMSVNLTLTPALLLAFGGFFSYFETPWLVRKLCPCCASSSPKAKPEQIQMQRRDDAVPVVTSASASLNSDVEAFLDSVHPDEQYPKVREQITSFWYQSAHFSTTTKWSIIIIIVITLAAIPFIVQVFNMKTTIDTNQLIPRNAPGLKLYNDLMTFFPPGQISPYQVTIVSAGSDTGGVLNQTFWNATWDLIGQFQLRCPGVDNNSITAISWVGGTPWPLSQTKYCLSNQSDPNCAIYLQLYGMTVNSSVITYMSIDVTFDPTGDQSPEFISDARDVMADWIRTYPMYQIYLNGGAVNTYDAVNEVHALFPYMIGGTCAAVFVIVGVLFRSFFVPIRLLITIALPITWVYGFSVLVFQDKAFEAFSSNLKGINALYWLIPVMCFSILVGLGLDYDIFLFSRVVEYRKLGYNDRAAIAKGIYRTGGIITAAGIIMFISFSGLMLSTEMALNQYGFMLAFAVLIDTFIVRTLLVPAIMQLAGPVNWWPGYMPPATKDVICQDEEPEDLDDPDGGHKPFSAEGKAGPARRRDSSEDMDPPSVDRSLNEPSDR